MTLPGCTHDDHFEFTAELSQFEGERPFTLLRASVRCSVCHTFFHFRGIQSGHPNPDEPTVSADGFELRCPILPGPGAVVGLLEKTGLTDALKRPQNGSGQ